MRYIKASKKILSVVLAFILLVNANMSVFAQNIPTSTNNFVLSSSALRAEIKERLNIIDEQYIKDFYRHETRLKDAIYDVDYQGKINNYGEVCYNDICAPYHTYMRGLIGALFEFAEGDWEILQNYITEIRNAAFAAAIASEDIPQIKETFKTVFEKNITNCGTTSIWGDIAAIGGELLDTAKENLNLKDRDFDKDQKAQNSCQKAMESLTMLSVLTDKGQSAKDTADYIYKILDKYQNSTYANLVLMETIAALSFIDTDYSYSLIEKFLTQDTTPSITGNKTREALNMFLPSGIFEAVRRQILEEGLHETKYLNRYNEHWQYINLDATEKEGVSSFWLSNAAYNAAKDDKVVYHIVFNNILTDIGDFLSSQDGRGKKLAKKIVNQYANAAEEERQTMHLPLILGLIQNLDLQDALPAAKILNSNFYYDINGGTGKMVAQKTVLPNSGLIVNKHNVISERAFLALKDARNVLMSFDLIVAAFTLISLARSMPAIISKLKDLRSIRAINKAVSVAKAGNVSSNVTKAAPVFNQIAAVGKTSTALTTSGRGALNIKSIALTPAKIAKPAVSANTLNAALKFRKGLEGKGFLSSKPQFALTSSKLTKSPVKVPAQAVEVSDQTAVANAAAPVAEETARPGELLESVFNIMDEEYQFSGFLTEIPLFGINRQAIITVGHGVSHNPTGTFLLFNNADEFVADANVGFYKLVRDPETGSATEDYAILFPKKHLPQRPLDIVFNPQIEKYSKIFSVGYPKFNFTVRNLTRNSAFTQYNYGKDLTLFDGTAVQGVSGGVVLAETEPNKFAAIGTTIANAPFGKFNFTAMYSLNWLQRFLKGELDVSKLWAPNFNVSFVRPNKITGTLPENPFNVGITKPDFSVKPRKITFKPTANNIESNIGGNPDINNGITPFKFDRPYFPLTDFNQYEGATLFPMGNIGKRTNPMWGITDVYGNINKFLMYGTESDIRSMHSFGKMLEENGFKNKYRLITVEYPQFISVIDNGLPRNVWEDIAEIKGNVKYPSNAIMETYTTTPIRTSGAVWIEKDPGVNERFLENSDFTNNPITEGEWDEVLDLVQYVNEDGFIFDDFENSLILRRNSSGQLVLGFIKYKYNPLATDNYTDAIEMGRKLERVGLKANQNGVVKKSSKPTKQDVAKILNGVTRAEIVVTEYDSGKMVVHAVWRLYHQNDIVGYLKYGTEEEIINTRKAEKVFTENNLVERFNKYINVKYSRILADNADDLPPEILKKVYEEFDANKVAIRDAKDRAKKMFILSPVDTDVFCWGNLGNDLQSVYTALARLGGRPIKAEAWGEFFDLMLELEKAGVYYGDAYNNIGFKGKVGEKLDVIYTDFEDEGIANALKEVQNLGNSLNAYGLKEPNFYTDNVDLENLPF